MISLENITKFYGTYQALKGISFHIPKGQIVGFLGPNGAGKTTTMKILTGYISPASGKGLIDSLDVVSDSIEVKKRIGYLPENAPIYSDMRVIEYLDFVGNVRGLSGDNLKKREKEVLHITGLEPIRFKAISELSKGYRQRVGLAQALLHNPPILILDEPTSGLDPNQIIEIRDVIKTIGQEKTVLLSTHILSEVEATTDRVLIISQGKIVADGTTADLQSSQTDKSGVRIHVKIELSERSEKILPQKLEEQLNELPKIDKIQISYNESEDFWDISFNSEYEDDRFLRKLFFQLAVREKWVILELRKEELRLESIFQHLTQSTYPTSKEK